MRKGESWGFGAGHIVDRLAAGGGQAWPRPGDWPQEQRRLAGANTHLRPT